MLTHEKVKIKETRAYLLQKAKIFFHEHTRQEKKEKKRKNQRKYTRAIKLNGLERKKYRKTNNKNQEAIDMGNSALLRVTKTVTR